MSAAGIRLNGLTGIACILRFELPALLEMIEDDEGDYDSESEGEMGEVGGAIAISESDVTSQNS